MSEAVLQAVALHKRYTIHRGAVEVLRGASFSVAPGETVAILGRSGAGKSTLLNVLGGLDRPDAGEVLFAGRSLFALPERRRTAIRSEGMQNTPPPRKQAGITTMGLEVFRARFIRWGTAMPTKEMGPA